MKLYGIIHSLDKPIEVKPSYKGFGGHCIELDPDRDPIVIQVERPWIPPYEVNDIKYRFQVDDIELFNMLVRTKEMQAIACFDFPYIDKLKNSYRRLRENNDYYLNYDLAGKFFVRENEVVRLYNERKIITKGADNLDETAYVITEKSFRERNVSVPAVYKIISTYGESARKPSIIILGLFFFSFSFWLIYFNDPPPILLSVGFPPSQNSSYIYTAVDRSLYDILPLISLNSDNTVIDSLVKVFSSIFGFGFLIIALRRRFERKFRH